MLPAVSEPVLIVGGGLAGLCCAKALSAAGLPCTILEAGDAVGGRVRTDPVDGFLLDRGFQVYLDSYPEAKRVLDHAALDLQNFQAGALVKLAGRDDPVPLVDPLRVPKKSLKTAVSPAATFGDKWHVATLRARVGRGEAEAVLDEPAGSTQQYLRDYGFSETVIESFFRPFYGGVFLDGSLATSSRLFLWLFRLFATGNACLPARGMGEIPRQIAASLTAEVRLDTAVESVDGREVTLGGGKKVSGRAVVVATEATAAAGLLEGRLPGDFNARAPQSSTTLYFAADAAPTGENLILLNGTGDKGPVNTVADLTAAAPTYAADDRTLLSVSVLGETDADDAALEASVRTHLAKLLPAADVGAWRHLKTYRIAYSLPDSRPPALEKPHKSTDVGGGLFLCGDHRDTASINGAMLSGRRAAEAVVKWLL